jgi:hypothetical protein
MWWLLSASVSGSVRWAVDDLWHLNQGPLCVCVCVCVHISVPVCLPLCPYLMCKNIPTLSQTRPFHPLPHHSNNVPATGDPSQPGHVCREGCQAGPALTVPLYSHILPVLLASLSLPPGSPCPTPAAQGPLCKVASTVWFSFFLSF